MTHICLQIFYFYFTNSVFYKLNNSNHFRFLAVLSKRQISAEIGTLIPNFSVNRKIYDFVITNAKMYSSETREASL